MMEHKSVVKDERQTIEAGACQSSSGSHMGRMRAIGRWLGTSLRRSPKRAIHHRVLSRTALSLLCHQRVSPRPWTSLHSSTLSDPHNELARFLDAIFHDATRVY